VRAKSLLALLAAIALTFVVSGIAFAHIESKTINTTTGDCSPGESDCGSFVYGATGITGTITASGEELIVDYLCTHTPGDAAFKSYGASYTLTLYVSGAVVGTDSYTATGGQDCIDGNNAVSGSTEGVAYDFGAGTTVQYSLLIGGVTAANCPTTFPTSTFNSTLNRVFDPADGSHANSQSVPPCGPPVEIPEAPASALLLITGGLLAGAFVIRRRRSTVRLAA
jgi:hypothetical protein